MATNLWFWVGFNVLVLALLALDLGVFHRKAHAVGLREAATWSVVWVTLALLFGLGIYLYAGSEPGLEYLTGYLLEKALAVDNIFVFVLLFSYFAVPAEYQHRVLFWGVLGALVMRGAFIGLGAYLLHRWHWVIYLFGAVLLATGIRMALKRDEPADVGKNPVVRLGRRLLPLTDGYRGAAFVVTERGRRMATPLLLVLLVVEATDVVFAIDSIPAIFAITDDPFLVYTSNVFAILGLRSMYFLLAGVIHKFVYLKLALSAVLAFIGGKMLLTGVVRIPIGISLAVVAALVGGSIAASLIFPPGGREGERTPRPPGSAP